MATGTSQQLLRDLEYYVHCILGRKLRWFKNAIFTPSTRQRIQAKQVKPGLSKTSVYLLV